MPPESGRDRGFATDAAGSAGSGDDRRLGHLPAATFLINCRIGPYRKCHLRMILYDSWAAFMSLRPCLQDALSHRLNLEMKTCHPKA